MLPTRNPITGLHIQYCRAKLRELSAAQRLDKQTLGSPHILGETNKVQCAAQTRQYLITCWHLTMNELKEIPLAHKMDPSPAFPWDWTKELLKIREELTQKISEDPADCPTLWLLF
jgi:hypothetical protein